ncbi:MAG: TonB C-terminal domain-containing protein [Verrucomicrobiota bacterium]
MKTQLSISPAPNKKRLIIGILLTGVLAGGVISFLNSPAETSRPPAKKNDIVSITLPPPPPPKVEPPPPPKAAPPKEEMVEQDPVDKVEAPDETAASDPADEALGTNIAGNGPDMGLRAGSGSGTRNRIGGGRHGGKWDSFAVKVQNTIAETLRQNAGTRNAAFSMKVLVWADSNGRITRATPVGSSGNATVDQAVKNQVFAGLQLPEAPPADMPMPINMRISARKGSF